MFFSILLSILFSYTNCMLVNFIFNYFLSRFKSKTLFIRLQAQQFYINIQIKLILLRDIIVQFPKTKLETRNMLFDLVN